MSVLNSNTHTCAIYMCVWFTLYHLRYSSALNTTCVFGNRIDAKALMQQPPNIYAYCLARLKTKKTKQNKVKQKTKQNKNKNKTKTKTKNKKQKKKSVSVPMGSLCI